MFDFLGYCFRPRSVRGPYSRNVFCGFTPAVSKHALNAMRSTIRGLKLRKRTEVTLDDVARELNPKVRGWIAITGITRAQRSTRWLATSTKHWLFG